MLCNNFHLPRGLEKKLTKLLNLVNVLEKGVALHLKKSKVSSIKDLPILAEISSVILVKILINFVNVYPYFLIISPWKMV